MKEKYRDFHFGEFIEKPNQCGYFEQNGNWYTYVIDERNLQKLEMEDYGKAKNISFDKNTGEIQGMMITK